MSSGSNLRRRTLLLGGTATALAAVTAGAGAASIEGHLPGTARLRRALGLTGPDGTIPRIPAGPVRIDQQHSAARGRTVTLATMLPPGTKPRTPLPVCLMLHGRGSDARQMVSLGTPQFLAAAVRSGVPPFAIVAVDGGDASYWHQRTPGDDPQAMLRDELPAWLRSRGLPPLPRAALGISMGGSGALQYGLTRRQPLDAIALLSPALFRSWADARPTDAYNNESDWRAHEPLLHLNGRPPSRSLALWCGAEDPFYPAARALSPHTQQSHFPHGTHTQGFWRRVLPAALTFLGTH